MNKQFVRRSASILCIAIASGCLYAGQSLAGQYAGAKVGAIENGKVDEASGLAASRRNVGVLWAHNDSGDGAFVYALSTTGKNLARYRLADVRTRDCEDIAIGPGPQKGIEYLYLADIGDNFSMWPEVYVYRVPEPNLVSADKAVDAVLGGVETITLRYADGPRDAETLMVDPQTQDLYVVSKRDIRSRLYRARGGKDVSKTGTLEFIGELPWGLATAGDISLDGTAMIIRNYLTASIWRRSSKAPLGLPGTPVEHILLIGEPQGEAIAFDADGKGFYTTSEGRSAPLYHYTRPSTAHTDQETVHQTHPPATP